VTEARLVWAAGARLGEGALWDDRLARLWWVDIEGRRLHRTDAAGRDHASWDLPHRPGFVALTEDPEHLILGLQPGLFLYTPCTGRLDPLAVPEGHAAAHRLNDGKVDGAGRLWFSTMVIDERPGLGALHQLERPGRCLRLDAPFTVPNGPAFSPDGGRLYLADSPARRVFVMEIEDGRPIHRREFLRFAENDGYPDGMTMDMEGCLWVAHWDGGCVSRFAPDGTRLESITLPVARVTSCAFGGDGLRTLFITTAGGPGVAPEGEAPEGSLFAADTATCGLPSGRVQLPPNAAS
jgi:xylono-1,5-lactonase